jgi:hypothetical protein
MNEAVRLTTEALKGASSTPALDRSSSESRGIKRVIPKKSSLAWENSQAKLLFAFYRKLNGYFLKTR